MKLNCLAFLLTASVAVAAASNDDTSVTLLRGVTRKLGDKDIEVVDAKYNAEKHKCTLTYMVEGGDEMTIKFDNIDEKDDKVICYKEVNAPTGVDLPFEADDFDATWKDEDGDKVEVKDQEFTWKEKNSDDLAKLVIYKKDEGRNDKEIEVVDAKYNAEEDKCTLTYKIKGSDYKKTINFDDIDEMDDKVICKEKVEPPKGVDLPFEANDFDAIWKDKDGDKVEVKDEEFTWNDDYRAKLIIYREEEDHDPMDEDDFKVLKARYKSYEKRCTLTYKVKGYGRQKISFDDIEEDGDEVVCSDKADAKGGVRLPVDAKNFDAVWKEKDGDTVEVESARLLWEKNKKIKLKLKRERGGMDEDDFKTIRVEYNAKRGKCKFIYRVKGESRERIWLNDSIVEKNNGKKVICKERKVNPTDGVHLPVVAKDIDAKWINDDGEEEDVDTANLSWDDSETIKATIKLDY